MSLNRYFNVNQPSNASDAHDIEVYGFGTTAEGLDVSDSRGGSWLGTLHVPAGLGVGEDVYLDITSFVQNTSAPYLVFNLRMDPRITDIERFSSLEANVGHPSQLILSMVPEPGSGYLLAAGLTGLAGWLRRRRLPA